MKNIFSYEKFNLLKETVEVQTDIEVIHLSKYERRQNQDLVFELAENIHASDAQSEYTELFLPDFVKKMASGYQNKKRAFFQMLMEQPSDLWIVRYNERAIGFILIITPPDGMDRIGFGINSQYTGKGILLQAFNQIKDDIEYPLYGETSVKNIASQKLLTKMGFEKEKEFDFAGVASFRYKKSEP